MDGQTDRQWTTGFRKAHLSFQLKAQVSYKQPNELCQQKWQLFGFVSNVLNLVSAITIVQSICMPISSTLLSKIVFEFQYRKKNRVLLHAINACSTQQIPVWFTCTCIIIFQYTFSALKYWVLSIVQKRYLKINKLLSSHFEKIKIVMFTVYRLLTSEFDL